MRIFKRESELEIWKQRGDGRFHHFKTYPICMWSGDLGPKRKQGDKQAPEGFYSVNRHMMNPDSKFHLAFNLGYPNAYDRAHGRTGDFLMVHGDCSSAGCYAMTDVQMEEIYALAREAFIGGQAAFEVHAFPFRMTDENMALHREDPNFAFWEMLKPAYDLFELNRVPPTIAVCERRYVVNVANPSRKPHPKGRCPRFETPNVTPYLPSAPRRGRARCGDGSEAPRGRHAPATRQRLGPDGRGRPDPVEHDTGRLVAARTFFHTPAMTGHTTPLAKTIS